MTRRAEVFLIVTALAIWAFCGAIMAVGPFFVGLETTLYLHLVGGPAGAALAAYIYFRSFPKVSPILVAAVVVGLALGLDAGLVAPVFVGDWSMFQSPLGLWIPMALIFAAVLAAGYRAGRARA